MDLIPLFDETAPIACTAGAEELSARKTQIERLRAVLEQIERTPHGLLLHLPNRDDLDAELRRFAADEKGCCQFWGFDVQRDLGGLRLRWDGPPTVTELFDRLLEYFQGNRPIADFPGLL